MDGGGVEGFGRVFETPFGRGTGIFLVVKRGILRVWRSVRRAVFEGIFFVEVLDWVWRGLGRRFGEVFADCGGVFNPFTSARMSPH